MKVFALGGAGQFGKYAAQRLIASDTVSEIAIAGRNLEAARFSRPHVLHRTISL